MVRHSLTNAQVDSVESLARLCEQADGVNPLNDDARLNLADRSGRPGVSHCLVQEGDDVVAYAQVDQHRNGTLCVAPTHRRRGHARRLLAKLRSADAAGWWAFGTLPAAQALASCLDADDVRSLLILERSVDGLSVSPAPAGVQVRSFEPQDASDVVALNAQAFAHHPEQGALTLDEFEQRVASDWFDAAGLLLAERDGRLVGFHWTKKHQDAVGEVYVLATAPEAQGTGIGKHLLQSGLSHLARQGCTHVILYVESDEIIPISLYRSTGFSEKRKDTYYHLKG